MASAAVEALNGAINAYLQFVLSPDRAQDTSDDRVAGLIRHLDELAVGASHPLAYAFDHGDYDEPPAISYQKLYAQIADNFPELKYYHVAATDGTASDLISDPWNDIADIYIDLHEVHWRLKNTSAADALLHLHNSFRIHWGLHLRQLQLYLHEFQNGL
ncbi:MAG TPA: hypothetical protein VG839_09710 [Asticcacaulis sp.]|nr:hypothetical protein [Asticcacaulis sp.]